MSQLVGLVVYAPKGRRKRDDEDVPIKKIGKVRNVVCSPSGKRVVGLIVHQRDIAGMIAQPDLFVAYDAFEPYDKGIVISRPDDGVDNAARARLGLDWDSCIIWNGMDAKTEDDRQLGYVADIEFSAKTGKVRYFHLGDGNMSESLVGHVAVPGSMLIGYQDGWMIVDPEAAHLELSGGAAAKAGEGYARAKEGVSKEEAEKNKAELVHKISDPNRDKFNTVGQQDKIDEPLIKAMIDKTTKAHEGTRLRFKLLDDVSIKDLKLKKGTYLYGTVTGFGQQRVKATITSILIGNKFIKVNLSVFDNDGMEGFYVPESAFRDMMKDAGAQAMQQNISFEGDYNSGISGEAIALQALQNMYQSASSAVSANIRKNKARIKYNTIVYLVNTDIQ